MKIYYYYSYKHIKFRLLKTVNKFFTISIHRIDKV